MRSPARTRSAAAMATTCWTMAAAKTRSSISRSQIPFFRLLALRPSLPSPVYPKVLPQIDADEILDRLGVTLRDVTQWVGLVGPVPGPNDVLHAEFEEEAVVHPPGIADDDRHVVLHR